MRGYDGNPNHAYILLRVFNARTDNVGIKFYPNPWNLYLRDVLRFVAPGGYTVTEGSGA